MEQKDNTTSTTDYESDTVLNSILNTTNCFFIQKDDDYRILAINKSITKSLQVDCETVIDNALKAIFPEFIIQKRKVRIDKMNSKGKAILYQ